MALVVAAGGRAWPVSNPESVRVEADALAEELVREGVAEELILRERRSMTTRENARFTRELLARKSVEPWKVVLVTCAWHMPRAAAHFRSEGFEVETFAVEPGRSPLATRAYRVVRERVAWRLDRMLTVLVLCALSLACSHGGSKPGDASVGDAGALAAELSAIAIAEDTRQADLVTEAMRTSRDVNVRRRAARALSRIADAASETGLLRALDDEDAETAAWGAYGLGFSCKGHEEPRVRALVAREASFDVERGHGLEGPIDFGFAVARALGRCGGSLAESTLASWVRAKGRSPAWREDAAYAIGDVGARRGNLDDDTVTALLDAAADGVVSALYPFARTERFNDAFAARLLDAAKKASWGVKSDVRVFAVRALAKTGDAGVPELSRIAASADYAWSERIDAMRSLGKMGEAGHAATADALAHISPDPKDPFAVLALGGDVFGEIVVGLGALGTAQQTPNVVGVLTPLSTLRAPGDAPPSLARRLADLRCTASSLLARGNYDAPALRSCDAVGTEAYERGRLAALATRPLVGERRTAWITLTKSEHKKIREDALALVGQHRELGDVGLVVIATALADTAHSGVVAAAADVLFAHPDRAMVLSAKERKNALDPNAPPPTNAPEQEVSPVIAKALTIALSFAWSEGAIETRAGLLDAAAALHAPGAKEAAKAACGDPNITMREHASKALHTLGDDKTVCAAKAPITVAKEVVAPHGGKLVLTTDAGTLSVVFDANLAPVASTRILDLAKAGFFDGNVVHRVVPAFVVQLGDPQGDGYGGSGQSLRCETSPVPFGPLDVGIALGGRDTGSTQFFVALGRFPHLDGDYARVGHADGDWFGVAEGDVVQHVKVE